MTPDTEHDESLDLDDPIAVHIFNVLTSLNEFQSSVESDTA